MRLILLALLPAALAACGDNASVDPDATMPAPEASLEEAAQQTQEEPEAVVETLDGVWVTASDRGDPAARFGPEASEAIFSVICRSSSIEGETDTLVFQRTLTEVEAGETIDFLTSAGNASVDAVALDTEIPTIGGSLDPAATGAATLANASETMRVRSGTSDITIPVSEELKTVINDCRPEPVVEEDMTEDEAPAEGGEEDMIDRKSVV